MPDHTRNPDPPTTTTPGLDQTWQTAHPRTTERIEGLAAAAARGHTDSLGELYEICVDQTYRWLYVKTRSHHLAEEITSETWMAVAANIGGYRLRRGAGFTAWLFTIARNKLRDHYRSRVASTLPLTATGEMVEVAGKTCPDDNTALRVALADLVNSLPRSQRDTVILKHVVGLTLDEAATVLGKRPAAVRKAHTRALARLRGALEDCEVAS